METGEQDEFLALFGIKNPDLCYRCQIQPKVRGDMCEECAQASDAQIQANMADLRARDAAAGAASEAAENAGKSTDEQNAAYLAVKHAWGGKREGAGRRRQQVKVSVRPQSQDNDLIKEREVALASSYMAEKAVDAAKEAYLYLKEHSADKAVMEGARLMLDDLIAIRDAAEEAASDVLHDIWKKQPGFNPSEPYIWWPYKDQ